GRGQIDFTRTWNDHFVVALAGFEVRETATEGSSDIYYGYDPALGSSEPVNYAELYQLYPSFGHSTIPSSLTVRGTIDRYRSYFTNASYTYGNRYTLSVSGRLDQSNLFGVRTNQKSA